MLKKFFSFFLLLLLFDCLKCLSNYSKLNQVFKGSLERKGVFESNIFVIVFDKTVILTGVLTNFGNLKIINSLAKQLSFKFLKKNNFKNFLIYKDKNFYDDKFENKKVLLLVKNSLSKDKMIHLNNYKIYVICKTVWMVGYASSYYEKEVIIKKLHFLKKRGKITEFYCLIPYKKNKKKGFVYRHNI